MELIPDVSTIKLSFDGTIKVARSDFVLLTAGVLVHESKGISTSFRELVLCLVDVEAEDTYEVFAQ